MSRCYVTLVSGRVPRNLGKWWNLTKTLSFTTKWLLYVHAACPKIKGTKIQPGFVDTTLNHQNSDWFDSAGHFLGFLLLDDISHALLETNTTSDSAGKSAWKTILAFKGLKHLCRSYMASAKITKVDLFWSPNARSWLLGFQGRKIAIYSNICLFEFAWLHSHQRQFSKEILPKHGLSLSSGFVK